MPKIRVYLEAILIPLGLGLLVSFFLKDSFQYDHLVKPSLAPPGWIFPIVWTILYSLMGISYAILKTKGLNNSEVKSIYYRQLIVNLIWPILFFGAEQRGIAFILILVLVLLVIKMTTIFYAQNKLAGLLQIPYLIWLLLATYLNYQAFVLN